MSIEVKISKRRISYKIAMKFLHKRVEKLKINKGEELSICIREKDTEKFKTIASEINESNADKFKAIASDISASNTENFLTVAADKFEALSKKSDESLNKKKELILPKFFHQTF